MKSILILGFLHIFIISHIGVCAGLRSSLVETTSSSSWESGKFKDQILDAPLMLGATSLDAICSHKPSGFCSDGSSIPLYITHVGRKLTEAVRDYANGSQSKDHVFNDKLRSTRINRLCNIFRHYRDLDSTDTGLTAGQAAQRKDFATMADRLYVLKMFLKYLRQPLLTNAVYNEMMKNGAWNTENIRGVWDQLFEMPKPNRNAFFYLLYVLQYAQEKLQGKGVTYEYLAEQFDFYQTTLTSLNGQDDVCEDAKNNVDKKQSFPGYRNYIACLVYLFETYDYTHYENLAEIADIKNKETRFKRLPIKAKKN